MIPFEIWRIIPVASLKIKETYGKHKQNDSNDQKIFYPFV